MSKEKLSAGQKTVLQFIKSHIDETGFPPTRAEIAAGLGFRSANAAEEHLKALARKGAIELLAGTSRGISLKNSGLPLIGKVAAGQAILAIEHIESYYQIDSKLFRPKPDYLLKVKGMSMRDAGILSGDLLAVHRSPTARSGQIVVARIDDEVTVKRLERKGKQIRLLPANSQFKPILIKAGVNFAIEGIAVGLIRNGKLQ